MDDLFEEVNSRVPILDFIERETTLKAQKVGSTFRINPCPFCHHRDCFTIYPTTNSFHCFSCDQAGDVICFEKLHKNLPDNLSAAKSVSEKWGIDLKRQGRTAHSRPRPANTSDKNDKDAPQIDPGRARALRWLAAEFYHEQLMSDKKALEYQTKKRGHSLEVLKNLLVGFAGTKSLIKSMKEHGFSAEDLIQVGLIKKMKDGFKPVISRGFFIYPHMSTGNVLYFSIKDPSGKLKYQIKKIYADPEWLCFNQDALNAGGPIIICEGENDLISIVDKANWQNVICVIGNFNTSNILKYLIAHSEGKSFYLCFDKDEKGQQYTEEYAKAILAGGGQVRVIEVPEVAE